MTYFNINLSTLLLAACLLFSAGCDCSQQQTEVSHVFEKGKAGPGELFTGQVWVKGLISDDTVFTTGGGEVYFEAGARSNWHSHPSGQILIVTAGTGYHQIKGQPIEVIHKGDVVKCPPNVSHWHGASKDASMSHIYIVPNTERGIVEWGNPVTDEEYEQVD